MRRRIAIALVVTTCAVLAALLLADCSAPTGTPPTGPQELSLYVEEPSTLDPQYAPEGETGTLNVFDRLVETRVVSDETMVEPSLAESVDVSSDGLVYTFTLHDGVTFSNGSPLTAHDVEFTLTRLAGHPESPHAHIVSNIAGASDVAAGTVDSLAGITSTDDLTVSVRLTRPQPSFLASLASTGASILDAETMDKVPNVFGAVPEATVGTGPYVYKTWEHKDSLTLGANKTCWSGEPEVPRAVLEFLADGKPYDSMFEEGRIDVLDVRGDDTYVEYLSRGDVFRKNLVRGLKADAAYLVLNSSNASLGDVRVRQALTEALDRTTLLKAAIGGRGALLDGLLPTQLTCGSENDPTLTYDPEHARALLAEAGQDEGLELALGLHSSASQAERTLIELVAWMWDAVGVRTTVRELGEADFAAAQEDGTLACWYDSVLAEYDEPDAIFRSLLQEDPRAGIAAFVTDGTKLAARTEQTSAIEDEQERLEAYRQIEQQLVLQDHNVVPLYSHSQVYVVSDRVEGLALRWNGASGIDLREVRLAQGQG